MNINKVRFSLIAVDNQMKAIECGAVDVIVNAVKTHISNIAICKNGCGAIGSILSSQKNYTKYCTPNILELAKECKERHMESEENKCFFLGLMREEDPRIRDAVSRGVCTKSVIPGCKNDCEFDKNVYCPKCCIHQKVFRCYTCDENENKFYCETCWDKFHKTHKCGAFFCPVKCATEIK